MIHTAAYLRNRCPTNLNQNKTPEELWTGRKPEVSHLRIIGSTAFVLSKGLRKGKFAPKSEEFKLIGYSEEAKAYRLWKKGSRLVIKGRDVRVIEKDPEINNTVPSENTDMFHDYEYVTDTQEKLETQIATKEVESKKTEEDDLNEKTKEIEKNIPDEDNEVNNECEVINIEEPSPENNTVPSENGVEKPAGIYRPRREAADEGIKRRKASEKSHKNQKANLATYDLDPKNYQEATESSDHKEWISAMQDEYNSLIENRTWELVDRPVNRNIIGCKWVFKTKYDSEGLILRRKARLVAKGYSQEFGIDYNETFSPVVRQSSIRLLFAIAAEKNLNLHQMDVTTAFLHGELTEEIFMEQPEGFVAENNCKKVCKLKKALYGLKQAGRQWNLKLDKKLIEIGFTKSNYDKCIYFYKNGNKLTIIAVYVDDMILATDDDDFIASLKQQLSQEFKMRDLGEPKQVVGIEVERNKQTGTIEMSQRAYIRSLLKKYNIKSSNAHQLPLQPKLKLKKDEGTAVDVTKYQELIGSLMYLAVYSRPDIALSVSILAQFNQSPRDHHWKAAIAVLGYLKSTENLKLVYRRTGDFLHGYVDASWAEDINDRKSHSGFIFIFGGAAVSWESRKQRVVATSSAEAEYIALTSAAKEAYYLRYLLEELDLGSSEATILFNDSQSAQCLVKCEGRHSRTKHIHYRYHYIRDAVENGVVNLQYLPTEQMPADVLTKALAKKQHHFCCDMFGLNGGEDV